MRDLYISRLLTAVPFAVLVALRVFAAWQIGVSEIFSTKTRSPTGFSLKYGPLPFVEYWPDWATGASLGTISEAASIPVAALLSVIILVSSFLGLSWPGLLVFLLIADIIPVYLILRLMRSNNKVLTALVLYSLSTTPLLLLLGPDLTGSILLFSAAALVLSLSVRKFGWAGIASLLLVVTDPTLGVLLSTCLLVLLSRMRLRVREWIWLLSPTVIYALISAYLAFKPEFQVASIESPAVGFLLSYNVKFGSGSLSVVLVAALLFMGILWRIRRVNENLIAFAASSLVFILSLFPDAPATWALVIVPLILVLVLRLTPWKSVVGIAALNSQGLMFAIKVFGGHTFISMHSVLLVLHQTLSIILGLLAVSFIWKSEVTNSDFLRLRSRPALVLIAGDSGVGKDTLAEGLARSLGMDATVLVSGDDYHVWDRGKASWNFVTHLNPSANELSRFARDVMLLTEGRSIEKGTYDHKLGRRLTPETSRSREFVVASGLHALWARDLNQLAALKIFISMSEDLRILLKTNRDSMQRGYVKSEVLDVMRRRNADSENFIAPQKNEADLAMHLESDTGFSLEDSAAVKIYFSSMPMLFDENLVSELSNTCGLEVMWESEGATRTISVSGNAEIEGIRHAFSRLEPEVSSVLGPDIEFDKGSAGVIQMVVLVYLVSALRLERLI